MNLRLMTEVMYKSQCWTLPYGIKKMHLLLGNIQPETNDPYFKHLILWINQFKISRTAHYMTVSPTGRNCYGHVGSRGIQLGRKRKIIGIKCSWVQVIGIQLFSILVGII